MKVRCDKCGAGALVVEVVDHGRMFYGIDCPRCGVHIPHALAKRSDHSISSRQLRPRGLSAEDHQLMAEDQDLDLLRATRPPQQPHEGEQVPDNEIHKRPEQAASLDHDTSAEPSEFEGPESRGRVYEPYGR